MRFVECRFLGGAMSFLRGRGRKIGVESFNRSAQWTATLPMAVCSAREAIVLTIPSCVFRQGKIPESANWNSDGSYMVARGKSALYADDLVGRYSSDFIEKSWGRGLDLNQRLQERPAKQGWTPPSAAAVRWPSSAGVANCSESCADLLPTCDMLNQLERLKTSMETLGI